MALRIRRKGMAVGTALVLALFAPANVFAETAPAGAAQAQPIPAPAAPTKPINPATPDTPTKPAITQEQADQLFRKYFALPDGSGRLELQLRNYGGGRATWELMYTVESPDGHGSTGWGIGSIDAQTGRLIHMNLLGPDLAPLPTGPSAEPQPEEVARAKAWELVKALYPDEAPGLQPAPDGVGNAFAYYGSSNGYDIYNFTWMQTHEGVPVTAAFIHVALDRHTLRPLAVDSPFSTAITYPPGTATLTPDEALAKYRQAMTPQLVYQAVSALSYPFGGKPSQVKLVYSLGTPGLLDAITGKFVDSTGKETGPAGQPEPVPAGTGAVTPGKLPLTLDDAVALSKAILEPPADAQLNTDQNYVGPDQATSLSINWYHPTWNGMVNFDRQTGMIRNAYRSRPSTEPYDPSKLPPAPTDEQKAQAKQVAIAFVQQFFSPVASQLRLLPQPNPEFYGSEPMITFQFQRVEQNIPVNFDTIRVTIDPKTMQWSNINGNWTPGIAFPDPTSVISPQQALDSYMQGLQAIPVYQTKYEAIPPMPPRDANQPQSAMLVYQLNGRDSLMPFGLVDAYTGQLIDYYGQTTRSPAELDKLLKGHWAESELRYMVGRQMIQPDLLSPTGALTRADGLKMLLMGSQSVYGFGGDPKTMPYTDISATDNAYGLVMEAYLMRVLRPEGEKPVFGADQPVTRAEFATWMIRTLRFGPLARADLKVSSSFTDLAELTPEERNSVAFLEALGLVKPGVDFRGHDPLTQAEGAALTVRLANYLKTAR